MTLLRTNVADDANKEWRDVVDHRWRIDALAAADECDAQAIIVVRCSGHHRANLARGGL